MHCKRTACCDQGKFLWLFLPNIKSNAMALSCMKVNFICFCIFLHFFAFCFHYYLFIEICEWVMFGAREPKVILLIELLLQEWSWKWGRRKKFGVISRSPIVKINDQKHEWRTSHRRWERIFFIIHTGTQKLPVVHTSKLCLH